MVLKPMAADAYEPTFSMGDDSPLAPLAGRPRPVAHYLRQRFAQVTNPPIDPLRERRVMSLRVLLGPRAPLLSERARRERACSASTRSSSSPRRSTSCADPEVKPVHHGDRIDAASPSPTGPTACGRGRRPAPTGPSELVADGRRRS